MRKVVAGLLIVIVAMTCISATPADAAEGKGRGGFMGFIAGCCFGPRAFGDYNAGKEIHWREWCRLIPYVNIVFMIWDGIDGASGVTTEQMAGKYGAAFY